jgi:probable HAF family extracellular repeat protein
MKIITALLLAAVSLPAKTLVSSKATAVNDLGLIVGTRCWDDGTCRATMWFRDQFVLDLGTIGQQPSAATGINNLGQVVGYVGSPGGTTHAVLWNWGQKIDLGVLSPGDVSSQATGINDLGWIVGGSCKAPLAVVPPPPDPLAGLPNPQCRAWVHKGGKMQALGLIPGGVTSWATAIARNGDIAGYGDAPFPSPPFPADYFRHSIDAIRWGANGVVKEHLGGNAMDTKAFDLNPTALVGVLASMGFYHDANTTQLFDPNRPGVNHSVFYGINSRNEVAGVWIAEGVYLIPISWQAGAFTTLPLPSLPPNGEALAINDFGLIVGYANNRALMWENGAFKALKE